VGILDDDVAKVRDATDLVALASEHLALKRVGSRMVGLCPFHSEKTPSFSINPEIGRYYCLAGETRVITWDGPREIRELSGSTVRILTTNGRWVEAPFFSFGVQPLMKITLSRNRVRKVVHATPEHRWFVRTDRGGRKERTTADLRPGDPLSWSFPQRRLAHRVRLSPFGVAHGITFGDGTRFRKGAAVDLHGTQDAELLKWFPLNHTYDCQRTSANGSERSFIKVVDLPGYFKDRPSLDESPSYLLGWLAGYLAADGCVAKDGTVMLNSASRDNLEFVRLVCTRVGIGTYGITEQRRAGFPGRDETNLFRIHLINEDLVEDFFLLSEHRLRFGGSQKQWTRRGWVVRSIEPTDRVEEVFCAVVEGEHAFTLEDNILTGNCFGCQASGDAISFVREVEHLDFVEAVERLASRAGITLRYDDKAIAKDRTRKQRLIEAVAASIVFYHRLLLESPEGGLARRYLRSRGFDGDAARQFQLGWSPDDFGRLSHHLQQTGFARNDLVDAGLAFVNKVNKLQDQFRARLMFPIYDSRGEAAGFGGRALGSDGPKYKNSPETPIYQKSRLLYGLNWAKAEIVARGEVVICEGYTDVMAFALAGAPNSVATCGTALADDHFQILKNLARKVVLAYDSDAAGQGAAEKWYAWEQRYEMQLQVADLPAGRDPADVWHDDPQQLVAALERAAPFLQFRLDRVLAAADLSTLEGRARAGESGAAIVAEHPNDLVRDQYVMKLAGSLDIDADMMRDAVARARSGGGVAVGARASRPAERRAPARGEAERSTTTARPLRVDRRELDVLLYAVHDPELVADWLDGRLFGDPVARAAFERIADTPDFHQALEAADGPVRELLERIAVEEPIGSDEPETLRAHLMANTIGPAAQRVLMAMLRAGDDRATSVKVLLDALAHAREMGDWAAVQGHAMQLLAWVDDGSRGAGAAWGEAP
jgi:DNA primase